MECGHRPGSAGIEWRGQWTRISFTAEGWEKNGPLLCSAFNFDLAAAVKTSSVPAQVSATLASGLDPFFLLWDEWLGGLISFAICLNSEVWISEKSLESLIFKNSLGFVCSLFALLGHACR